MDSGEYGFGVFLSPLVPGIDCPRHASFLPVTMHQDNGQPVDIPNAPRPTALLSGWLPRIGLNCPRSVGGRGRGDHQMEGSRGCAAGSAVTTR
jgi:hypothetical protein